MANKVALQTLMTPEAIGQSDAFLDYVTKLAAEADAAVREC